MYALQKFIKLLRLKGESETPYKIRSSFLTAQFLANVILKQ